MFCQKRNKKGDIGNAEEKILWSAFWEEARGDIPKDTDGRKKSGNITSSPQDRTKEERKEKGGISKQGQKRFDDSVGEAIPGSLIARP